MAESDPTSVSDAPRPGTPGSTTEQHPHDAIPLPEHGFRTLDDLPVRALSVVPAVEVIRSAAVLLMKASAERLGLSTDGEPHVDLDEARQLIDGLAGLLAATQEQLGDGRQPMVDGLRTLQRAFREAAAFPDEPGNGPGERFLS